MNVRQFRKSAVTILMLAAALPVSAQMIKAEPPLALPPAGLFTPDSVRVDLNGDGQDELIAFANFWNGGSAGYIYCVDRALDQVRLCGLDAIPKENARVRRTQTFEDSRGRFLAFLESGSQILAYPLSKRGPLQQVPLSAGAINLTFADLNQDQKAELILARNGQLIVQDWPDMTVRWTRSGQPVGLLASNLDVDPQPEIVIAELSSSMILDGLTGAPEWIYPAAMGDTLVERPASLNGPLGFLAGAHVFTAFRALPYSPLYSVKLRATDIVLSDLDQDGNDDAILIDDELSAAPVINLADGTPLNGIELEGMNLMVLPATASNPANARVLSKRYDSGGWSLGIYLASLSGQVLDGMAEAYEGYASPLYADLDQDGQVEAMALSGRDRYSALHVFAPNTGRELWRKKSPFQAQLPDSLDDALVMQVDADTALEVLVTGSDGFSHMVARIDGVTGALEDQREDDFGFVARDVPGALEIGALQSGTVIVDVFPLQNGLRIQQFQPSTLDVVRTHDLSTSLGREISATQMMNLDADTDPELLVATNTHVVAFDLQNQTVLWNYPVAFAALAPWDHAAEQGILVLAQSGQLYRLSLAGAVVQTGADFGQTASAIASLPGESTTYVACVDRRLVVIDTLQQVIASRSRELGIDACARDGLAIQPSAAPGRYRVLTAGRAGAQPFSVDPGALWSDGMEGSYYFSDNID